MRKVFLDDLPHSRTGKSIKWNESIGRKISFIFDEYQGEIDIIDYKFDGKYGKLTVLYDDYQHQIYPQILIDCNLTFLINKGVKKNNYNNKHRDFKWKYEIGDEVIDGSRKIKITNRRVIYDENNHIKKQYQYYCYKCGFDSQDCYTNGIKENDFWSSEHSLYYSKSGCVCCSGKVIKANINSIAITDKWILSHLKNKENGYKYGRGSRAIVQIKCPICGYEKTDSIMHFITNKATCPKCSDGFSYPNKLMFNLLTQIGIKFDSEYSPEWIAGRRFDFYIPSKKIIIEMDGGLGHGNRSINDITPEQSVAIDNWKDRQAMRHDLSVIRIDCYKSDLEYIKHNILSSLLCQYLDLSKVNWIDCDTYAKGSLYIDVVNYYNKTNDKTMNIADKFKVSQKTVIEYLKNANKNGIVYYNAEEKTKSSQFQGYRVLQFDMLTLKKIAEYDSISQAEKSTSICRNSIKKCCDRKLAIAGNYIWRFDGEIDDIPNWKMENLKNMHQKK